MAHGARGGTASNRLVSPRALTWNSWSPGFGLPTGTGSITIAGRRCPAGWSASFAQLSGVDQYFKKIHDELASGDLNKFLEALQALGPEPSTENLAAAVGMVDELGLHAAKAGPAVYNMADTSEVLPAPASPDTATMEPCPARAAAWAAAMRATRSSRSTNDTSRD